MKNQIILNLEAKIDRMNLQQEIITKNKNIWKHDDINVRKYLFNHIRKVKQKAQEELFFERLMAA